MKISNVLVLRSIVPLNSDPMVIKEDVKKEMEKVGKLLHIEVRNRNIYFEYEKVEYAQIAYLVLKNHKYDGKSINR